MTFYKVENLEKLIDYDQHLISFLILFYKSVKFCKAYSSMTFYAVIQDKYQNTIWRHSKRERKRKCGHIFFIFFLFLSLFLNDVTGNFVLCPVLQHKILYWNMPTICNNFILPN